MIYWQSVSKNGERVDAGFRFVYPEGAGDESANAKENAAAGDEEKQESPGVGVYRPCGRSMYCSGRLRRVIQILGGSTERGLGEAPAKLAVAVGEEPVVGL